MSLSSLMLLSLWKTMSATDRRRFFRGSFAEAAPCSRSLPWQFLRFTAKERESKAFFPSLRTSYFVSHFLRNLRMSSWDSWLEQNTKSQQCEAFGNKSQTRSCFSLKPLDVALDVLFGTLFASSTHVALRQWI